MREILDLQKQLLPDLLETMQKRYAILHQIKVSGLIGRRTLANALEMTERVLRAEVDFLKAQGFVEIEAAGMRLSEPGLQLIESLAPVMNEMLGLTDLEERLRRHFNLKQVVVVPGNADTSVQTRMELGRAGAIVLRDNVTFEQTIAVTGGSTLARVAAHLTSSAALKGCWFVPARGGLGESVELQANTIASQMAKKTGGQYRLLHVPDNLSKEAYDSLVQEPNIREVIDFVRNCGIVVHGIGEAMVMARRRKVDPDTMAVMREEGALAESFGYYFDRLGKVVHQMPTLGLRLEDIERTQLVIGVAGGESKAEAILAVLRFGQEDVLITDEAAAEAMLQRLGPLS